MERCKWVNLKNKKYVDYHDNEWCHKHTDDHYLLEFLILESLQAGLSFECILNKREYIREALDDYDINKIINYDDNKVNELLNNKNIIRHKGKILAIINNTKIFNNLSNQYHGFINYLYSFTGTSTIYEYNKTTSDLSKKISKDLQSKGMKYVGETIIYSYLQSIGIINSHDENCYLYKIEKE